MSASMPTGRIYKPSKSATQSGLKGTREWVLEFEPSEPRQIEHLMGWTGSGDTNQQVKLRFESKEQAIAYADKHQIPYRVQEPKAKKFLRKSYADNFAFNRIDVFELPRTRKTRAS